MGAIPSTLLDALCPVTVVVGHYGTGKTNFCVNLACDLSAQGGAVTVIDLDIVNPYFRASEQRAVLEGRGVRLVAPVFAEAGTSLDVPSLTGRITPAIEGAKEGSFVLIDAGGDDAGATALGRYGRFIRARGYALLCVLNRFRNLVAEPADAVENLREIEAACGLTATALVNNSHLREETDERTIASGLDYARKVSHLTDLPLVCTTAPAGIETGDIANVYELSRAVTFPWE